MELDSRTSASGQEKNLLRVIRGVDKGTNETRTATTGAENVLLLASQEMESNCTQITEQALPKAATAVQKS